MDKDKILSSGLVVLIIVVLLILWAVLPPHTDQGVVINGTHAYVPAGKTLILYGNKLSLTINREGNEVVIKHFLSPDQRITLCGYHCEVKTTINLFLELKFRDEEAGAFSADWPPISLNPKP